MSKHTETPSQALPQLKPLVHSILSWAQRPSALAMALGAMPALALAAMPTGGKVVAGAATISNPDGSHTVVNQSSDKAVLNWQSFSIGEGGHVQFVQRDANSVALNRVVGSDPSSILGNLSANGQIFLVNQNGIFFGHSAKVDVAGIVATTLDIRDEDFMRGDYLFSRGANAPARATVINEGALNANGGYVVLAGDYAANKGVVQAQLGTVLLASGDSLTLQMAGSSLINYQVDKATVAHLAGVENSGQILANGGRVIMTADVAQDLAATVVNNSGLIQAQSAVEKNGAIYFEGNGGNVANSGTLDASAQAGANGGHVEIRSTHDIAHEAGSRIDVSGAGEGTSDAGSVYTWADGTNRYNEGAQIAARGGAQGGNGGDVELSGNHVVNRSIVDLSAANGELGTLTLDPLAITIADGAGANSDDGATIFEQNLEAQLKVGNVSLLATGQDASITVGALSDGVLDGSNAGAGGSLTLRAEGGGNPTVSFADKTNTIKVDKAIAISTGDIEAPASGTIDVGHLDAGTRIDLDSGSIRAASLTVKKTIATVSDNSYAINARARTGNLTVDGDVTLDVTNTAVGSVASAVSLRSDSGDVAIGGNVSANATGMGYYFYNWTTGGNAATSYYGQQPWTLVAQGDHAVSATLDIRAAGSVSAGDINVLATDTNTAFGSSIGGYWQTANATQHNFWRPTATSASGSINAGADVAIGGKTTVKADGYAVNDYTETESYRTMVNNFYYTSANQTVRTQGCLGYSNGVCTGYGYNGSYVYTDTRMKGGATGNYIWQFGEYTSSLPGSANDTPNYSRTTDYSTGSGTTGMGYTGARGMSATLDVTAGGSVSLKGMEVHANNRSATGSASFTDANWGRQDTAANLNGTGNSFTSNSREIDYDDNFGTRYTAAGTTARANISAGDNGLVSLGGASHDVVAEIAGMAPSATYQADASLTITAGASGGASGNGLITIENGLNLVGAKNGDIALNIRNYDGAINADGAPIVVTNGNSGADARASVQSDNAAVHLESLAVTAGRSAYLTLNGDSLLVDGASRATVTGPNSVGTAQVRMNANGDISTGDILATSNRNLVTRVSDYYSDGYDYTVDGGSASIDVRSVAGSLDLRGDIKAAGNKSADVNLNAYGAGATLRTGAGKTVSANANGATYTTTTWQRYLSVPTYSAGVTLGSNGAMDVGSSVEATLANRNGAANVYLGTNGGAGAAITQGAGSRVLADGSSGRVIVQAGNSAPLGAAANLAGSVAARGTSGSATVLVSAASGSLHDFGASSNTSNASVSFSARDAAGTLTVDGSGAISANVNAADGASLNLNASGALDAGAMNASVANNSTGANAGAGAWTSSSNGNQRLGSLAVSGYKSANVSAVSSGDLAVTGTVSATNSAASSGVQSVVSANGKLSVEAAGAVNATAYGSLGNASVNLYGAIGAAIDGDVAATANASATVLLSTGAADALLAQRTGSTIAANAGGRAAVNVYAGSSNNAAFDLQGDVRASATSDAATIAVTGKGGAVHGLYVNSALAQAVADINALNGDLALTGNANLGGNNYAALNAAASGALSVDGALAASVSGSSATAQANLTAFGGGLAVGQDGSVGTTAVLGRADTNLTARGAMRVDGDLSATTLAGDASVDLITTGGAQSAITQGAGSTIAARGATAAIGIKAGNAYPNENIAGAAAFQLDGSLRANGGVNGTGGASIDVIGASGAVHDFAANAGNGGANVTLAALSGDLALDGTGSVSGTRGAVSLGVEANGALDAGAATISVANTGANAPDVAQAGFDAYGGSAKLGATTVQAAGGAASLYASSTGAMTLPANLAASSAASTAVIGLATTGGADATITQDAGKAIVASGSDASVSISAGSTKSGARAAFALGGDVQALARNGAASIEIDGASGSVHDFSAQSANGMASATIAAVDAGGKLVLDGSGSVGAHANDLQGAWLQVRSEGALDTGEAILAVENDGSGDYSGNYSGARADLHANGGDALLGAASVGGARSAVLEAGASGKLDVKADLSASAGAVAGNASVSLDAAASVTVANTAGIVAGAVNTGGGASAVIHGGQGVAIEGNVAAGAASQAGVAIQASGGDIAIDGNVGATSARNASIGVNAVDGSLSQTGTVRAGGANSAQVDFMSKGALTVSGDIAAAATADGSIDGQHTGSASVNLTTTGGAGASITQGADSTIEAVGRAAHLTVKAGSSDMGRDISATAAFDLGGTLRAVDAIGGSSLVIGGASGRVHDFSVTAQNAPASAVITAFNGDVVLDGTGNVVANTSSSAGASLRIDAAGAIDTSAAQIGVANLSGDDGASARAELYAQGAAKLGDLSVSANAAAALTALAGADVDVTGRLSAAGTAAYGQGRVDLGAANAVGIGANGVVNVTGGSTMGSASLNLDGSHGVTVDGSLNAYANEAGIGLLASGGDVVLNGALAAQGADRAAIDASAGGKLVQAAGSTLHSGATGGVAEIRLASNGSMTIDGQLSATATADGSIDGAHSGAALIDLATVGGASASLTQGAGSTIQAVGLAARLDVAAGDRNPGDDVARGAAFKLDGALRAIDDIGGSALRIAGASGSVHDFTVSAGDAPASARIDAYNGDLVLNGAGSVRSAGNGGASLLASASGALDTSAAALNVTNNGSGNAAGAQASLAAGGKAVLGTVNLAGGTASLDVTAGGDVAITRALDAKASGEAAIGLTSTNGAIALGSDLTALGGERASIGVHALGGTLTQAANTVVQSGATAGVAEIDLASKGAMAIGGNIAAAATADGSIGGAHTGAALVSLTTVGGATANIVQDAASTIEAVGRAARLAINAGSSNPGENVAQAAAFRLDGTLRSIDAFDGASLDVSGASGSVHDFTVAAGSAGADASITAVNGGLVLTGSGTVSGNSDALDGASLNLAASGALDTRGTTLTVANALGGAQATLAANGGNALLGAMNVAGGDAALDATASGKVVVTKTLSANAGGQASVKLAGDAGVDVQNALNASGNAATIDLASAKGGIALGSDLTALGGERAGIAVNAFGGTLTQAANTVVHSGATAGVAEIDLASQGAMTINGKLAAATADGSIGGAHTGAALINLTTIGGATANIVQDQASTIEAAGRAARLAINAGSGNPAGDVAKAAGFKLDGTLRAIDETGGASLQIAGSGGSVRGFTVAAADATAHADVAAVNGDLVITGNATVSGNADTADGARLTLAASGSLDTTGVTLDVSNLNSGDAAGAQAVLLASTGAAKLGVTKVTAQGGGTAAFQATAGSTLDVNAKLDAANLGLGATAGKASVKLNTTGKTALLSTVTQNSGATITAATSGNAGNATVDIQAGDCCNSAVALNDTVKAVVTGGSGNATLAVRGNTIKVKDLTANVTQNGSGNSMVSLGAPSDLVLTGTIDSQAASATARAGVQLVSDKLVDGATFKLSKGNGQVQLSAFNTGAIIGVHSDKDFDETADVNFMMATLKKFVTQGAELRFGGEYDRSAWIDADGKVCLPGMEAWASQLQHTGAIHVAGNGRLNLGDVKMVFDTTGTTTYHDPKMSAWSVPTGRVATLVVPPSNVDRYLDRTDNTLQNMNKVVQDSSATRTSGAAEAGQPAQRGARIGGKLFMDGNGVNMVRNEAVDGSQADAQGPESKSRNNGDSTEQ